MRRIFGIIYNCNPMATILPKKLAHGSNINLFHTSSPVEKRDVAAFKKVLARLKQKYPNTKLYDVAQTELDPRYLAASANERMRKFRQAKKEANWLLPVYGGTGCSDLVRRIAKQDLQGIFRKRPIVSGFSDNTHLLNYLYFKLRLVTFHYTNAVGLFHDKNWRLFFDIISGRKNMFSFYSAKYHWITKKAPQHPISGIAVGGNLTVFRNFVDMFSIKPYSWEPYILFLEDFDLDAEDFHGTISALAQHGVFDRARALVIGEFAEKEHQSYFKKLDKIFTQRKKKGPLLYIEYLLSDIISKREKENDPLYILKIDNLGHHVKKDSFIIPIGGHTKIYPDKKIEFTGPFVE